MQKFSLNKFHIHIEIERLPTITLYATFIIAIICLLSAGWITYKKVYIPYLNDTIPEEKLTQKQDKLNVKDFEEVRSKLDAKQKSIPDTVIVDPFQIHKP